jgi:hypothetical protein
MQNVIILIKIAVGFTVGEYWRGGGGEYSGTFLHYSKSFFPLHFIVGNRLKIACRGDILLLSVRPWLEWQ